MTASAVRDTPTPPDLVDRDSDLAHLDASLARALDGEGALVLLEGPAGIGKSALLATLRSRLAQDRATVLTARAGELEQEFPFGVVRQLFEALLADPAQREQRLVGAAAPAAPVFLDPEEAGTAEAGAFATLHGLYWLTADLAAARPVVLLVDDLHWCDVASLRYLAYLVRRLDGLPILVAATLRTGEAGVDPRLIGELEQDPATDVLLLAPLTVEATATLVRARLGETADPGFCQACHDASAGNPLLLRQLLRALESDRIAPTADEVATVLEVGPRAVSRTVLLRLARLPPEAISLARAVSVLGDGASLEIASKLSGVPPRAAADATGPLARAEILRPELPLEFVHPLVRDAIYRELPPGERARGHDAAAGVLRDAGAEAREIAKHLLHTPPDGREWATELLHDAGLDALTRGAPESAVSYLRRALVEPAPTDRQGRLLYDLGRAEGLTDGFAGADHLTEALERLRDPGLRLQTGFILLRLLTLTGRPVEAHELCGRLLAEVGADDLDARSRLASFQRMAEHFSGGEIPVAGPIGLPPGASGTSIGEKALMAIGAFERCAGGYGADEVVPLALAAVVDGVLIAVDETFFSVAAMRALSDADRPETLALWDDAIAEAHRQGSVASALGIYLWRGYTLLRRGELPEALASLDRSAALLAEWGASPVAIAYQSAIKADVLVELGDVAQARAVLDPALGQAPPGSEVTRLQNAANVRLLLAEQRPQEALAGAEAHGRALARMTNPVWNPWRSLQAAALTALGREDEAVVLLEDELADARAWGAPGALGRTLRLLGAVRRDEAQLREAVTVLSGSPARLEHAKALLALGGMLRRERRPTEAREPLREAHDVATGCGAQPVADAARTELQASGARPRGTALSGPGALTASERRVADLAAAGHSNRDIAQQLYVTAKTVEVHLSNTYRKLGIASRRELSGVLEAA